MMGKNRAEPDFAYGFIITTLNPFVGFKQDLDNDYISITQIKEGYIRVKDGRTSKRK